MVTCRPLARFQGLGGKVFVFIIYFKKFLLGSTKFGGHKKLRALPRLRPVSTGLVTYMQVV